MPSFDNFLQMLNAMRVHEPTAYSRDHQQARYAPYSDINDSGYFEVYCSGCHSIAVSREDIWVISREDLDRSLATLRQGRGRIAMLLQPQVFNTEGQERILEALRRITPSMNPPVTMINQDDVEAFITRINQSEVNPVAGSLEPLLERVDSPSDMPRELVRTRFERLISGPDLFGFPEGGAE